jgi:hypothetical protein
MEYRHRIDPRADARLTHPQIGTNPAQAMVARNQTGSVISRQLAQFGVGANIAWSYPLFN